MNDFKYSQKSTHKRYHINIQKTHRSTVFYIDKKVQSLQ